MSIWDDVNFDHAAAGDAAEECRRAARILTETNQDRLSEAKEARDDWSGPARENFDWEIDSLAAKTSELIEQLLRAAGTIESASEEAVAEQQRRVDAREAEVAEQEREVAGAGQGQSTP